MSILEVIKSRRSIRKFKSKEINQDDIFRIIEAGIWAPSSGNTMPFKFFVLANEEQKSEFFTLVLNAVVNWKKEVAEKKGITITDLRQNYKSYLDEIQKAPIMIFLFFDLEKGAKEFTNEDIGEFTKNEYLYNSLRDSLFLCVENMLLEASAIGLGSLYFELPRVAKTPVNQFFSINEKYEFFMCLPVGYPDEEPKSKERNVEDFLIETTINA